MAPSADKANANEEVDIRSRWAAVPVITLPFHLAVDEAPLGFRIPEAVGGELVAVPDA